jgi:asparagine synthase (glutamine-hydrolysing)
MCGIAGFQGDFSAELLIRMTAAVAHRGPDGCGLAMLGSAGGFPTGLGHRRLSIIDLSPAGGQPMTVDCEACGARGLEALALTYNGELYNYAELGRRLKQNGHRFHSRSDSEVLLHWYGERGTELLRDLNGIFAFAIRDGRATGRPAGIERGDLLLARDHYGVKPLYIAEHPRGFLFASEIKSLLQFEGLDRALDLEALNHHLTYLWSPAPRTLLAHVQKVPPGHALVARKGRIERRYRYHHPSYQSGAAHSFEEDATQVRDRLDQAVARQMVADVPVGAFLSGGLDSSSVVAAMKRHAPHVPVRCYGIGFEPGVDVEGNPADLPYAARVAKALGVDLVEVRVGPDSIDQLDRMLYFLDEPQADPAPINALLIAERARQDGIKVLLSGAAGDDLFAGYRRHRALQAERWWRWLPGPIRSLVGTAARGVEAGRGAWRMRGATSRRLVKLAVNVDRDLEHRLVAAFWWGSDELRNGLFTGDVARVIGETDPAEPLMKTLGELPPDLDPLQRMLCLERTHFLADHNLNYTDKMGMAVGVEVRVPFLDRDLVDLATAIPSAHLVRHGVGKAVLRRAAEPFLPREVLHRPKTGFGAPLRRWLGRELRPRVDEVLSARSLRNRGLFDPTAVSALIKMDRDHRVDASYVVFGMMCVELWCRMFLDATPAAPPAAAH